MGDFLMGHDVLRDYLHYFVTGNRFCFLPYSISSPLK